MPLTVTQQLIDDGYLALVKTLNGQEVSSDTIAIIVMRAITVVNGLLDAKTKHVYRTELLLAILRKLIDSQIPPSLLRTDLHAFVEANGTEMMPRKSLFACCTR